MPQFTPIARRLLARLIAHLPDDISREELTENFVRLLQADNRRFDAADFRREATK